MQWFRQKVTTGGSKDRGIPNDCSVRQPEHRGPVEVMVRMSWDGVLGKARILVSLRAQARPQLESHLWIDVGGDEADKAAAAAVTLALHQGDRYQEKLDIREADAAAREAIRHMARPSALQLQQAAAGRAGGRMDA